MAEEPQDGREMVGGLAILRRWKKEAMQMWVILSSKPRWGSNLTPKIVTEGERERLWPKKDQGGPCPLLALLPVFN